MERCIIAVLVIIIIILLCRDCQCGAKCSCFKSSNFIPIISTHIPETFKSIVRYVQV